MKNTKEILNLVPIALMNDYEWEEYYYFNNSRNDENINLEEIQKFKKERLEQNENAPSWIKMEEYIIKYKNDLIGWLAYFNTEKCTFMLDANLKDISDTILESLLYNINDILSELNKDSVFLWSKNSSTSNRLIALGAELLENEDSDIPDSQFVLTKSFINKIISKNS